MQTNRKRNDLKGSIHTLEERYENLVRLLSRLTECLEAHLSELEMLEADMSMACVYASPEIMVEKREKDGFLKRLFKRK